MPKRLQIHIDSVHKGIKKLKKDLCTLCGKTFESKTGLKIHTESVHEGLRPHMCTECGNSYSSKGRVSTEE